MAGSPLTTPRTPQLVNRLGQVPSAPQTSRCPCSSPRAWAHPPAVPQADPARAEPMAPHHCLAAGPASLLLHEPARENPCERLLLRAVGLSHGAPENPFFLWVPDSFQDGIPQYSFGTCVHRSIFFIPVAWVRGPPTPTIPSAFLPRCPQPQNGCTTVAGQVSLLQHLLGGSEPATLQGRRRCAPDKQRAGPGGADRERAPLGSAPPSKSTPAPAAGFVLSHSLPIKGNMEVNGLVHPSRFARAPRRATRSAEVLVQVTQVRGRGSAVGALHTGKNWQHRDLPQSLVAEPGVDVTRLQGEGLLQPPQQPARGLPYSGPSSGTTRTAAGPQRERAGHRCPILWTGGISDDHSWELATESH